MQHIMFVCVSHSGAHSLSVFFLQVWPVLCAGSASRRSEGVTPSLTLSMHLNPPASPSSQSSTSPAALSRPTSRPSSGRSAALRPSSANGTAASGGTGSAAVASIQLRPTTVWLSLPFLRRLQTFFEPLSTVPAAATQHDRYETSSLPHRCAAEAMTHICQTDSNLYVDV